MHTHTHRVLYAVLEHLLILVYNIVLCTVMLCINVYMYTLSSCGTSMYITHPSMSVYSSHLQVIPPKSVRGRWGHFITATSLGPGLTEVLMFGGQLKWGGDLIAETTILRFGEGVDTVHCIAFSYTGLPM